MNRNTPDNAQDRRRRISDKERADELQKKVEGLERRLQAAGVDRFDTMPHNDEAERAVIGCVFLNNKTYHTIAGIINGRKDFYTPSARHIWRVFSGLIEDDPQGTPIDVLTVCDELQRLGLLEACGGPGFVSRVSSETPSAANVEYYASIVRKLSDLRKLIMIAGKMGNAAYDRADTPSALINEFLGEVLKIVGSNGSQLVTAAEADREWQADYDEMMSGAGAATSTGIKPIDVLLKGGVRPGRSYYVGGLTKMGKTTLAVAIVAYLVFKKGWACEWITVENIPVVVEDLFLSYLTKLDMEYYKEQCRENPNSPEVEDMRHKVQAARAMFREAPIRIQAEGAPNIDNVVANTRAKAAMLGEGQKLLVVGDYLQNFSVRNYRASEYDRLTEVSKKFNGISKSIKNVAVMGLFQFGKDSEKAWRDHRRAPHFSEVKGSSQFGNDANHMLIAHRNWRDKPQDALNEEYMTVEQPLSRHGNLGWKVELRVNMTTKRMRSWPDGIRPPAETEHEESQQGGKSNGSAYPF